MPSPLRDAIQPEAPEPSCTPEAAAAGSPAAAQGRVAETTDTAEMRPKLTAPPSVTEAPQRINRSGLSFRLSVAISRRRYGDRLPRRAAVRSGPK